MDFWLQQLKLMLRMFGIGDLRITFDSEQKQIKARFVYQGKQTEKIISFQDIETIFQDGDTSSVARPCEAEPIAKGITNTPPQN